MKKKILLIILCGVCLLGVTGCGAKKEKKVQQNSGDKKLTCIGKLIITDDGGVKFGEIDKGEEKGTEIKYTFSFDKNDNIKSIIVDTSQKLDDSLSDDEINKEIKELKEKYKEDEDDYDDYDVKRDGNKLITQIKTNSKDKIENGKEGDYDDYDTTKSFYEKKGLTCE